MPFKPLSAVNLLSSSRNILDSTRQAPASLESIVSTLETMLGEEHTTQAVAYRLLVAYLDPIVVSRQTFNLAWDIHHSSPNHNCDTLPCLAKIKSSLPQIVTRMALKATHLQHCHMGLGPNI
jgi:hypothetical protein